MNPVRVVYHPVGAQSGAKLGAALGAETLSMNEGKTASPGPQWLIRYGTNVNTPTGKVGELNTGKAIGTQKHRIDQLHVLKMAGVDVPSWIPSPPSAGTPLIAHTVAHEHGLFGRTLSNVGKGDGVQFYPVGSTLDLKNHAFFTAVIPKARQFRVHVVRNKGCRREVMPLNPSDLIWNIDVNAKEVIAKHYPSNLIQVAVAAVKALKLDFGAVDIVQDKYNKLYVLEVNTAPGLGGDTLAWYVEKFKAIFKGAN